MQQIINFIIRNKTFLLFLLLFGISLTLTIQSHSYHRSKFINSANSLSGGVYGTFNSIGKYFNLKEQNEILAEENKQLRNLLFNAQKNEDSIYVDSSFAEGHYKVITAEVYKNSYALTDNYLTINKGRNDSVKQDFGVISSKGIIGIIDNTSNSYATVLSILNTNSRINAKIKATNHLGTLEWNGLSPHIAQLVDVSKFAPVKLGDTIETGGQSAIFPKGIGIGIVEKFETDISGDTYNIEVKLFNDMTNLGTVYIIENLDKDEIKTLENTVND